MARRRPPTPEERRLWRLATRDVEPLPGRELEPLPPEPAPTPPPSPQPKPRARPTPPAPKLPLPDLAPDRMPGVDRRSAERLRRGRLEIDARLDLHGMKQAEAQAALVRFVHDSAERGHRTVLVITGKGNFAGGESILRARLPDWLNDPALRGLIVAYTPAQPKDGGSGAFYVRLKRARA